MEEPVFQWFPARNDGFDAAPLTTPATVLSLRYRRIEKSYAAKTGRNLKKRVLPVSTGRRLKQSVPIGSGLLMMDGAFINSLLLRQMTDRNDGIDVLYGRNLWGGIPAQ